MKRALPVLCLFLCCHSALAQEKTTPAAQKRKPGLPILRSANENAWLANFAYYAPQPGFDRLNRDIDLREIRIARAWHFPQGWEFELGGLLFSATGTRTAPSLLPNPPQQPSNALGAGIGPLFRWNFVEFKRWRFFAYIEEDLILSNKQFPAEGTRYNGFFHGGGGATFRLNKSYWLEAGFRWTHISNGQGFGQGNPTWQGRGVSVGIRRSVQRETTSLARPGKGLLPLFRKADENAWVTNTEYYAPLPGFNRQNRDIDVQVFQVARVWHFPNGLEFQFGGLALHAYGNLGSPSSTPRPPSGTLGLGTGPLVRWNFLQVRGWRFFADGQSDFIFTQGPLPAGGTRYNFFSRGGGGASFRLHESYFLEVGFRWAHISNGQGSGRDNPGWSGQGISLALRHTFP